MVINNVVQVRNLTVSYKKNIILKKFNITIEEGSIIGFLGPSGSGKTTFVKALVGMAPITSGEIKIFDTLVPNLLLTNKIGYMAQSDALYNDLTALDNLLFFGELYGIKGKIAKERALELLKLVDLEAHMKKPVMNFSGGMKRRLSLAIALFHKPMLLILDEPTVGLDPILRKTFWEKFKRIKAYGGTIIITTHVMDEAYFCDELALIRDGNLIAHGTVEKLLEESSTSNMQDAFLHYSLSMEVH